MAARNFTLVSHSATKFSERFVPLNRNGTRWWTCSSVNLLGLAPHDRHPRSRLRISARRFFHPGPYRSMSVSRRFCPAAAHSVEQNSRRERR